MVPVDVEVAGPGPCIKLESGDGFLDLKAFLKMRFISLKGQRQRFLDYVSERVLNMELTYTGLSSAVLFPQSYQPP